MPPDAENPDSLPNPRTSPQHLERIAETFDREHPKLLRWLLGKAPREDAEDILGEAFTQVQARPPQSVSRLAAYVRATVENLLANYYRDKAAHRRKLVSLEPEKSGTAVSPEPALIEQQLKDLIGRTVERMEPLYRFALQLRLYEDLSTQEIVARFAERGIQLTERTVQRYLEQGYEICRLALMTSEKPKQERANE